MLKINESAPDFTLNDKDGKSVSLKDFRGKTVVLYFYPKDNTAGCSAQAVGFAALADKYKELGAIIIGISKDSEASHRKFAEKYSLPFTLLSDSERSAIDAYGVWKEKKMCGKVGMGIVRSTFIISPDGRLEKIMDNVKAKDNPTDVLNYLISR